MNILAIDTATEACSAALLRDGTVFSRRRVVPQGHTDVLLDMCDELLDESDLEKKDLDLIVCGRGPGSFTGVRIGIGIAQGLSFGLNLKLLGISDLMILAQGCIRRSGAENIAVAIDARMGEVYFALFHSNNGAAELIGSEQVCPPADAVSIIDSHFSGKPFAVTGTGFNAYDELNKYAIENGASFSPDMLPDAVDMLDLALRLVDKADDPENLIPTYLRNDVTWKKTGEQKKKDC
jgi:tRNA threonylcarbamoyladenosine biosynthesis protein TsaB